MEPPEWTAAHHSDTILPQHLDPIGGLNICSTYELAFVQEKKKVVFDIKNGKILGGKYV